MKAFTNKVEFKTNTLFQVWRDLEELRFYLVFLMVLDWILKSLLSILDQFVTFRPFCEFIVNLYSGKYLRHRQWPLKKSDAKYFAEKRLFIFETSTKYLASEFGEFIAQVTLVLFEGAPVCLRWRCHGVWKSQKKSHSTLRAKRATFTFWVDKS